MVRITKVAILFIILLAILLSGCARQQPVKDLSPEAIVKQFWADIGKGDYESAYGLAYHANENLTKQMWVDGHISRWGEKGNYIKIYNLTVIDTSPIDSSQFEGNFTEACVVNTNATISYMGQNETGQLRMILVNTSDGWKIFGNY